MNSYASIQNNDARVIDLHAYKYSSRAHDTKEPDIIAEDRWPAWKSSLFVVTTCSAFWISIAMALRAIF